MPQSNFGHLPRAASGTLKCPLEGAALLHSAQFNKGSAFSAEERGAFKLQGLLPPNIQTLDEQVERAYQQYKSRPDDLAKNTFLASMKAQSEVLFYQLLKSHLKEMFGVIYTPTEAEAIQNYSRLFRKPERCFLNIKEQDRIDEIFRNLPPGDIDYIVILGIGDQGVGAVLISSAKLAITTICGGIHPSRSLPVVLDCGTNNEHLLNDDLYLGLRQRRVRGEEYDAFVEKFVCAAKKRYPHAYIHFEDFGLQNAKRILEKYSSQISCFNDEIQGTGCVRLTAMLAGLHLSKVKLEDVRVVCFGAGSAGTGIADQISDAIATEADGSKEDATSQPGAFTEEIIKEMAKNPEDINTWTEGRALIATGSPFPPVKYQDVEKEIGECNNSTVFPGIGLGAILSRTSHLSMKMIVAASKALAAAAPALQAPTKPLLPDVEEVRDLSVKIAKAVIQEAVREGLAQEYDIPGDARELDDWIRVQMWEPTYRPLERID
ncbi:hypothetical protein PENANT_c008G03046 [Penicillium antarcticum]|uniref:Malic enzyme n=1 Tax=Penicillium antarcticum TaxID=416450 RepID=A0A1V6QBG7_9EURO|nr:hypothetical protein PENANT_c008G03046 [Penicillium antarcticum]